MNRSRLLSLLPPLPLLPRRRKRAGQRGVALLAVLWVLAAAGTATALGLATVRDGIATSHYRTEYTRARWAVEGCLAEFRGRLERIFSTPTLSAASVTSAVPANDAWIEPHAAIPPGCTLRLGPPTDGPVDVNAASDSSLRTLPGFDSVVVDAVLRERAWGRRFADLDGLLAALPPELRERLATVYPDLVGRVAFAPPAWVVTGHGMVGGRVIPIVSERWVRAGDRIAVVRRELR